MTSCAKTLPEEGTICTLVGCAGGVNVEISQLSAGQDYEAQLSLPSGETMTLHCGKETNQIPFEMMCNEDGVFFALPNDMPPPDTFTVTLTLAGEKVSREFSPEYEKTQPNGEDCPPICYNTTVEFNPAN